jgi:type IV secretory pathway VirB10-like protein
MRNNGSLLSADGSPQSVQPVGVRRLNHIPLYIIGLVSALVAVLIALVAFDKSKQQPAKPEDHGGNTDSYAAQVVGQKVGYVRAENATSPTPAPTPPAMTLAPAATPPPSAEMDARHKAFFEALYAKSAVTDPITEQVGAQRQQALSAAEAAKLVNADPNNLGGSTPGDIGDYERKVADAQRLSGINGGQPPGPLDPNGLGTYDARSRDRWRLNSRLEVPTTPYILRTGWVIPALLLTAMESELPGTITAQVSQDVYDSGTGNYLLIPQGSRLVGEYANAIQYGQSRIFVAWQRIIYPDNSALDIGAMPGADEQGEAGFSDQVNNHFVRLFGSALLMSAITGGITISQPQSNSTATHTSAADALSAALGQQLGAATSALLEKNLSIAPNAQNSAWLPLQYSSRERSDFRSALRGPKLLTARRRKNI